MKEDMNCKPFKTIEEQIEILENRGLCIPNKEYAVQTLSSINYYRLSAYSLTYRKDDQFYKGVCFEDILMIYHFDAAFRRLILEFSQKIEASLRTQLAYIHSKNHTPLGYLEADNFVHASAHETFLIRVKELIANSQEAFIVHHKKERNSVFPLWVAVEVMTFDVLSKCFANMLKEDQSEISKYYGVKAAFLENWLHCAVVARNISAHGGRFYNRPLATKVRVPKIVKDSVPCNKAFGYVYIIYQLLVGDETKKVFIARLKQLFISYPKALPRYLGFPDEWETVFSDTKR